MSNLRLNENTRKISEKGLIKAIIIIIIALVILGYFGFNISDIITGQTVQANLHTVWNFVLNVWNNYLVSPVKYIVGLLWKLIQAGLGLIGVK